jgi:hypothetical protein
MDGRHTGYCNISLQPGGNPFASVSIFIIMIYYDYDYYPARSLGHISSGWTMGGKLNLVLGGRKLVYIKRPATAT